MFCVGLIPLYVYQRRHPWNMLILAAWVNLLVFELQVT